MIVGASEGDFRGAVVSRLNIRIHSLIFETAAAEVNDPDPRLVVLFEQDILRFHITVDDMMAAEEFESD